MAFEGAEALVRMAWEAVVGVTPYGASWHDHRFNSETLSVNAPLIQPNSLSGGRQRTPGLPSKITVAGGLAVDWEPQGLGYYLAAFQKKSAAVTVLTAGQSWRHKLSPSETSVNHDKTFSMRLSRNNKLPQLSPGCYVSGFGINGAIQSVITGNINIMSTRASYYDMATVVLETGSPTRPILRGVPKYSALNDADADLYVTVTNVGGQVTYKHGAAGTATAAQVLTAGAWNTVKYHPAAADIDLGDADNPVQLYVPNFTGWTVTDAWRFKLNHTDLLEPWTPTFPAIKALNEIHGSLYIDGSATPTKFTEFTVNAELGVIPNFGIGGRFSDGLLETGLRNYSGQLNRKQIDNDLILRLIASERFKLDIVITSRVTIGSSTDPYRMRLVMPHCVFNGSSPNVQGPDVMDEPLPFDCYPDPDMLDGTHVDELTVYLDNSVADMTV